MAIRTVLEPHWTSQSGADPAPLVYNNNVYPFIGHDEDGSIDFNMRDWRLEFGYLQLGELASLGRSAEERFMAISVAVSDNILGPYKDAIGKPLIANNKIYPNVYIDDNGQAYLYWGNHNLWYARLNTDMISISGSPVQVQLTTADFGARRSCTNSQPTSYEEGPCIYKRGSL
ncbi:hypothetical protein E8E11_008714 [Didymella keratinophila]|nr:hypothetical protein E8E11_008714 [Didymella keratinophila]